MKRYERILKYRYRDRVKTNDHSGGRKINTFHNILGSAENNPTNGAETDFTATNPAVLFTPFEAEFSVQFLIWMLISACSQELQAHFPLPSLKITSPAEPQDVFSATYSSVFIFSFHLIFPRAPYPEMRV